MIPCGPSPLRVECYNEEPTEPVDVDQSPSGEEFGQMICVSLLLCESFWKVGTVVFGTGTVEGDIGRRDDSLF